MEYGPFSFDAFLSPLSSYPPRNEYSPYLCLGRVFIVRKLAVHMRKLDTNESSSLDRFPFVTWYVDEEVSLESSDEAERLVGWGFNVSLMDLQ